MDSYLFQINHAAKIEYKSEIEGRRTKGILKIQKNGHKKSPNTGCWDFK